MRMAAEDFENGLARGGQLAGLPPQTLGQLGQSGTRMMVAVWVFIHREIQCRRTVATPRPVPTIMAISFRKLM